MIRARFIWKTRTPLHCGGGTDSMQDQPVTRDAFGFWRIPGSTVAGLLRAFALPRLGKRRTDALFGEQSRETTPSLVWCSDAQLLDHDGRRAADKILSGERVNIRADAVVRDHVRLSLESGTYVKGGKFDEEIVPPGTCFAVEVVLDGWDRTTDSRQEEDFLGLVAALRGDIRFGGKRSNGYGRMEAVYAECRAYDMTNPQDVTDWLNLPNEPKFPEHSGRAVPSGKAAPLPLPDTRGISCELAIPLRTMGPLLVGGANNLDDADMTFLLTPFVDSTTEEGVLQHYTVPGSSVRGVLRHRVYKIAQTLGLDAQKVVDNLFGSIDKNADDKGLAGKVIVEDMYLPSATGATKVQHVAIDRFTGGAVKGALFDEAPVWKNELPLKLHIAAEGLTDVEAKLLLHALLDLATGELPLGGGVNRGNGRMCLAGLEQGLCAALRGVTGSCVRNGEKLDFNDSAMVGRWLDALEG